MAEPYVASLKGSAASDVDQALRGHEGHDLMAVTVFGIDDFDGQTYEEPFLALRCVDCTADVIQLEE